MTTRWTDFRIKHSRAKIGEGYIHDVIKKGELSESQVSAILLEKGYANYEVFDDVLQNLIDNDLLSPAHVTKILDMAEPTFTAYRLGDQDLMEDGDDNYDPYRSDVISSVGRFYNSIKILIRNKKLDEDHVTSLVNRLPSMYSQNCTSSSVLPPVNELLDELAQSGLLTTAHTPLIIPRIAHIGNPDTGCTGMSPEDKVFLFLQQQKLLLPEHSYSILFHLNMTERIGKQVIEQLARLNLLGIDAVDEIVRRVDPNHRWDRYGPLGYGYEIVEVLAHHGLLTKENKESLLEKLRGDGEPARSAIDKSGTRPANRPATAIAIDNERSPEPKTINE